MTVAELIEALKKLPQDKRVYAEGGSSLYDIAVEDYQNPKHPEDTFVLIYPAD
jgi:hypothetical protein